MNSAFRKFVIYFLILFSIIGFGFLSAKVSYSATCGTGGCEYGENIFNCPADCPPPAGIPTKPIENVLDDAIAWVLGFAIMVAVLALIWGGLNYVGSSGDSEKAKTAKDVIKYSLIGIIIVGFSYAVITILDAIF